MKQMIKTITLSIIATLISIASFAFQPAPAGENGGRVIYEYKQFSTVESVIPGGLGRSRILTTDDNGQMIEKDLKNFYSMVGLNFGNIANNDRAIVDRINQYSNEGWELFQVTAASHAQSSDGNSSGGIFITRYLFRRAK
jgi:hypothetical protein